MDIREIQRILPHRYPMLLVDRILELEVGKRATAIKNVTVNENFFQGHYPDRPIMPGVLILEHMAQVGALILLSDDQYAGILPLVAGFDNVRFRRIVSPGDRLTTVAELLWLRKGIGCMKCEARVDDEIAAEAQISFKVTNGEKA